MSNFLHKCNGDCKLYMLLLIAILCFLLYQCYNKEEFKKISKVEYEDASNDIMKLNNIFFDNKKSDDLTEITQIINSKYDLVKQDGTITQVLINDKGSYKSLLDKTDDNKLNKIFDNRKGTLNLIKYSKKNRVKLLKIENGQLMKLLIK
jgi:hypothetical protein